MFTPTQTRLKKALLPVMALLALLLLVFSYFSADALYYQPLHPVEAADSHIGLPPLVTPLVSLPVAEAPADLHQLSLIEPEANALATIEAPIAPIGNQPRLFEGQTIVLIMGVDRRPDEPMVARTDTMMLLSINAEHQTVSLLSIPRDLYVEIPGIGYDRINAAFVHGAQADGAGGGAALAMATVSHNLGVPVDHYVLVDFNAATRAVDALGGLDIHVPQAINDPHYPSQDYGVEPLYIPAGWNHFDGALALKYARTRYQGNDFGRMERQQQVVWAVRQRILELGVAELLERLPELYEQVQAGVYTDLSLEQIVGLAYTVKDIPAVNIYTAVLDYHSVQDYQTAGGAAVLVLRPETAIPLIQKLFYSPSFAPVAPPK